MENFKHGVPKKTFNLTVVYWHREHNDFQGSTLADPQCRLR